MASTGPLVWPISKNSLTPVTKLANDATLQLFLKSCDSENNPYGIGMIQSIFTRDQTLAAWTAISSPGAIPPADLYETVTLTLPAPLAPLADDATLTQAAGTLYKIRREAHTRGTADYHKQQAVHNFVKAHLFDSLPETAQEDLIAAAGEHTRNIGGGAFSLQTLSAAMSKCTALDQAAKLELYRTLDCVVHTSGDNPAAIINTMRTVFRTLESTAASTVNTDTQVSRVTGVFCNDVVMHKAMQTYLATTIDDDSATFNGLAKALLQAYKVAQKMPAAAATSKQMGFVANATAAPPAPSQTTLDTILQLILTQQQQYQAGIANAALGVRSPTKGGQSRGAGGRQQPQGRGQGAGLGGGQHFPPVPAHPHAPGDPKPYCWSHGFCTHFGDGCYYPYAGHDKTATFSDNRGGSQRGFARRFYV
jgi:hypothetical protein